ncbi:hypothetical protein JDS85_23615 [Bacillus cereus]|nr:hypothetical protein [Bacillus cereus]
MIYTNTKGYTYTLLQVIYMIKYKTVLNKEVQKEFPELYTQFIKQTNKKSMLLEIDEAKEKREELKNKLVK